MIYCIIKGKEVSVQHTYPNGNGIITTFLNFGKGCVSANSFSLEDYDTVEKFLLSQYNAEIINKLYR